MDACLFDIERGSVHDGPGLRTTIFLKGCPLRCDWCHNPESQKPQPQLSYNNSRCILCGKCAEVCPAQVHSFTENRHIVNFKACISCGRCVGVCMPSALLLYGYRRTAEQVFEVIRKDRVFFDQSGGGVTVSGGEPLFQADFCRALLLMCKEEGIHTCMETSGYGSEDSFRKILPVTDLLLFDWKVPDETAAGKYLGVSLQPIENNLRLAAENGNRILLRCPIIPGVNDTATHFDRILALLKKYPSLLGAALLPYHDFGLGKCIQIGKPARKFSVPSEKQKNEWLSYFQQHSVSNVTIG